MHIETRVICLYDTTGTGNKPDEDAFRYCACAAAPVANVNKAEHAQSVLPNFGRLNFLRVRHKGHLQLATELPTPRLHKLLLCVL